MLNIDALKQAQVTTAPFPYLIVPGFITQDGCEIINRDYPQIKASGSFPLSELKFGFQFQDFVNEIQGVQMRDVMAEKFQVCLHDLPTLVTVRGRAQAKDGRIHTDSVTKVITVLIYMNPAWENEGGRLRLLNSKENIDDYVAEVPPTEGTLLAFKVTPHSWHGHLPFVGQRRVIQLNWVTDQSVVDREIMRHKMSSKLKKLGTFFTRSA